MTTESSARQGQQILVQLGASALVGLIGLVLFLHTDRDEGLFFWFILTVLVTSAGEVAWFLSKYLRHARDRERLN
ncbi:hypothetical protein [Pedococcus sp. P5_B7]